MAGDYFDDRMVNRSRLLWTIATRRQLERWEPFVAAAVFLSYDDRVLGDVDIWSAQIEHHLALVAARNLLRALDLDPRSKVPVEPTLRAELKEGRDLHEHWVENLPVFNVRPRPQVDARHRSGSAFAERNPDRSPYSWLSWNGKTGALLLPHVPALSLHLVLDAVEVEVLADDAALSRFVPPRAPSPWIYQGGNWWPAKTR